MIEKRGQEDWAPLEEMVPADLFKAEVKAWARRTGVEPPDRPDRKTVRTSLKIESPADIGLDRQRSLLYVPQFLKDQGAIYQLRKH